MMCGVRCWKCVACASCKSKLRTAAAIETIAILRQVAKSSLAIAELKGVAETMPDQKMLVNAIILKEAK